MGFAKDHLIPLVDAGLGNSAYLVDLGDGRALAVDASRDLRALHAAARRRGLTVAFAADTHLHADFLSGAVQLGHDHGAVVLAAAAGGRAFPHRALADGDEADLGGLRLRALATPGHTDEHLAYRLLDGASSGTAGQDGPDGAWPRARSARSRTLAAGGPGEYAAAHGLRLVAEAQR